MTSSYDNIYSKFLGLIKSYELPSLSTADAYYLMNEWFTKVYGQPKVRKLFSSVALDNNIQEVSYELVNSIDENYDKEFVENMFANGMVVQWLEPKVNSDDEVLQFFGGKEQKWFAQSNHLNSTKELLKKAYSTLDKCFIRDHGYSAFVINGGLK